MTSLPEEIVVEIGDPEPPILVEVQADPPVVVEVAEVGLVGPRGPTGASAGAAFAYRQTTPSASWDVAHNLGGYPEPVLLLDDEPDRPVKTDLHYPDPDHTVIVLPAPATGWAYF